ncbi:MAG: zf-HC2 domain-containing protein [Candidatus Krumholzibacteriota bacterium]|nr:zf-HC2 domain-containing protein [Candidatus Krumholzibacteriota bacterium]
MMTCKEAARLISERKDHPLSFPRSISLRFHLLMCRVCVGYKNQIELISRISSRAGEMFLGSPDGTLSADAKEKMKQRLSENE